MLVGLALALGQTVEVMNAATANQAPIADAGSSRYAAQDPVVLDGTGSYDPDNFGPLTYSWRQIGGPPVDIGAANTATPTIGLQTSTGRGGLPIIGGFNQTGEIQECQFELLVTDGELTSLPDTVKIIIVREFGVSKLIHLNPPFDPDKPTWIRFGGLGGCGNIGSDPSWFEDWPEGWGGWGVLDEKVNCIWFEQIRPYDFETREKIGDMLIVYLSSHAPDYRQPIQTDGHSAGGQSAIDIGIYLNETYADARYAVNRVTLLDATGYCRDYSISIDRFLASAVDGEQCWIDSYPATLPGSYNQKWDFGFQANVLTVWFDAAYGSLGLQAKHEVPLDFYGNSLTAQNLQEFNHGVVAGAYWSVIGPGKNLQLASTPGLETYKFTWYGDGSSGYMDFYDEPNHPGRLPEPVTLVGPTDGAVVDANGTVLSCQESENAVRYQLLFGHDPYHMVYLFSDTPSPPGESVAAFPFEQCWWTVRACDQYGSTIHADPAHINADTVIAQTIENATTAQTYASVRQAINDARSGEEIVVHAGVCQYLENISFKGKNLTVRSTDPNDPAVVAATVINGGHRHSTVTFSGGEDANCVLDGFTITGGTVGISCYDAPPTIRNCTIGSNGAVAIEFSYGYEPTIIDCTILGGVYEQGDPNLMATWRLDQADGDIAYDSVGECDGILHGEPVWQPQGGMRAGALQFDGIDDYISTPFALNPGEGSFSVFAWAKGGAPGQAIMSQAEGTVRPNSTWLCTDPIDGRLITRLMHPPFPLLESQSVITDGQWHHMGLVYDRDNMNRCLYVDGAEVARDVGPVAALRCDGGLYIGVGESLEAGSFFSGLIDDVRIYDVALSAEEIAALGR
jgi:hypothetical protein